MQVFLVAAALGALARHADAHFPKVHLSNRIEPHMGLSGVAEGAAEHSSRRPLQVSLLSPGLQEVRMGERLELECVAFGGPPPTIQWLRDGQPVGQGVDEVKSFNSLLSPEAGLGLGLGLGLSGSLAGAGLSGPMSETQTGIAKITSRLVVDCALPVHRGVYSCAAVSGTDAEVSTPTSVYVQVDGVRNLSTLLSSCQHASPPRIATFASFVMDVSGSDITLPCTAEGNPRPAVFWKDNDNQLITPGGTAARRNRYKVLPNGSLVILKVRWSDMGVFTCVAQSEAGRDNATTFVYPLSAEK